MSNKRYAFTAIDKESFNPMLLYYTAATFGKDWQSIPHFHPFVEIIFITAGKGQMVIDDHQCNIKKGDLIIISNNVLHTEKSSDNNPMEYVILGIDNIAFNLIRNNIDDMDDATKDYIFPVYDFSIRFDKTNSYLTQIGEEIELKKINYEVMVQSLIRSFIIYIMRHSNLAVSETPPTVTTRTNKECAFVKQYIDSHFAYNLTVDDLAGKAFISKYHLIHSFKATYGMSPIQYLIRKRIDEAKALLKTTEYNITTISRAVGFSAPSHFTEKFKKMEHMTPYEYKKHCAGNNTPPPKKK